MREGFGSAEFVVVVGLESVSLHLNTHFILGLQLFEVEGFSVLGDDALLLDFEAVLSSLNLVEPRESLLFSHAVSLGVLSEKVALLSVLLSKSYP